MMLPHRTPFFLPFLFPSSLIWRFPAAQREIYLTFDDGPMAGPTDFVLDALKQYDAKATFFCIGDNIRKHEPVFRSILQQGHAVGNHTFNHLNGWKTKTGPYIANTAQCQDLIDKLIGGSFQGKRLFRPPYGRITRDQIKSLEDYKIIMWDVLSIDYDRNLTPEKCLRQTIKAVRPGSVILFHDSFKAEKNLTYTLPRFLEHYKEAGYSFKVVP